MNDLRDALKSNASFSKSFGPLSSHIGKIASNHVRNQASVAGNLVMARNLGFLSDLAPILQGAGASVEVLSKSGKVSKMDVETFLSGSNDFNDGDLIISVSIPKMESGVFRTYRSAVRPGNCHAILNTSMYVNSASKIEKCTLVFNGVMAPDVKGSRPVRASKTEAFLLNKSLKDASTVASATTKLCEEIGGMLSVSDTFEGKVDSKAVRLALVRGFFTKFAVSCNEGSETDEFKSAGRDLAADRPIVESKQEFPQNDDDSRTPV